MNMDFSLSEKYELIGKEGQKQLHKKTVTIIGLGGVGSAVAQILVRSNINLRLIDKERIISADVPRQNLYVAEDENKFKAKQAKKRLEEINKEVKIKTFHEELVQENRFLLNADLIIDVSNDMKTSLLINDYALQKRIPLIMANYAGEKGHVLIVERLQNKKGPCVACLQKKLQLLTHESVGVYPPTATVMAGLVANAAIKNLLDYKNVQTLLDVDIVLTEIKHKTVEKDKNCTHCKGL